MLHPNETDEKNAANFTLNVIHKIDKTKAVI
jgi:hypothetical protein